MITSNYQSQITPGFQVLSEDQKAYIHQATLELLRRTGVRVMVSEVRDLLAKAGCWTSDERVRIPPHLIDWAIRVAPNRVVLCNRRGEPAMSLERHNSFYGTGSDTPYVIDPHTGKRRHTVLEDIANVSRVVDALPNIDFIMCMGIASDVPESISDLYHFKAMVTNTEKPIVFTAWNRNNLENIIEMAQLVAGGKESLQRNPFCALYSEPIAPLVHGTESCHKLLYIASEGLPVVYTPGLMSGASSPVTMAGTVVQANAEHLSGLLICQLIREGTPVFGGSGMMSMDMATGQVAYGTPEFMLCLAALSEMCHYYDLPVFSFAGCSDSKVFDQQAAAEGAMWMMISALSGGNLIHDVGYIESGLTSSHEMLVSMDEVAGFVKYLMRGIEITDDTLALDVIDRVGPGGHFLNEDHTFRLFRKNWFPKLSDKQNREDWEQSGQLTLGDRARDRVLDLLKTYEPKKLDTSMVAELDNIISRAKERVEPNLEI
jgi:trimethylamine--corrinoid protein Co-methyltransferase